MTKYFIYVRKSSDEEERQVLSIEAQIAELRQYARDQNLIVAKEFQESQTARVPGRPEFAKMLSEIEKGKAQGILAWNPDRLARNWQDGGRIMTLVDSGTIQTLKFPTHWFEPTPHGKLMLSYAFGYAKFYSDNLSEVIHRGLRQKLRRGELPCKAPLGYVNEPKLRTIVPNPKTFTKVQAILEDFATGNFSMTAIRRKMTGMGIVGERSKKPLPLSSIGKFLTNPFYYGVFSYNGELHQGTHEPMISKQCFDDVQKALAARGKPRNRNKRGPKNFQFLGFATCGQCGYAVTAERHVKKSGLRFVYYRCTHKNKVEHCSERSFIREEKLAEEVRRNVKLVGLPDEWREKFLAKLDLWEAEGAASDSAVSARLAAELAEVKAKLKRLTALYLDGGLEVAEFKSLKNPLMEEKASVEERLQAIQAASNRLEPVRNWILEANQAHALGFSDTVGEMSSFLKRVGSNRLLSAQTLSVQFKKPWDSLAETTIAAQRAADFSTTNSGWWSRGDSNP